MMLIIGSIWAKFDAPVCGKTLKTAKFHISTSADGSKRKLQGNSCPGYDWRSQSYPALAGEHSFSYSLDTSPKINKDLTYVGVAYDAYVNGPIGITINGVPIYSPSTPEHTDAVIAYADFIDQCGGYNAPSKHFTFSAKVPGYYHYHSMPGDKYPHKHDRDYPTNDIQYCHESAAWYKETAGKHSPLVGFMADGIPIYGVQAQVHRRTYCCLYIC